MLVYSLLRHNKGKACGASQGLLLLLNLILAVLTWDLNTVLQILLLLQSAPLLPRCSSDGQPPLAHRTHHHHFVHQLPTWPTVRPTWDAKLAPVLVRHPGNV